jgi:D-glycero-alpha-D-manno-heptose-7-phosphate kinase
MTRRHGEATAPCRIDLAGGPLEIWPLYLFHPGAVTVSVAIDRRAWSRVELGGDGVQVQSKDTLQKASGATVEDILENGQLALVAHVLMALGVETGVQVVTQSKVPLGSGLGEASALAVAVASATCAALGRSIDPDRLWPLLRDAEARSIGVPTGPQDYQPALRGGTLALHLEPGEVRIEPLAVDPARVEESLLLVDGGAARLPGLNSWDVLKGQIDGDEGVREALGAIARIARGVREALVEGRYDDVVNLLAEEWEARKRLAAGATTPEIDRIVEVARQAGGAAKACGAGGGGVVAVWAPPGPRGQGRLPGLPRSSRPQGSRGRLRGYNQGFREVTRE